MVRRKISKELFCRSCARAVTLSAVSISSAILPYCSAQRFEQPTDAAEGVRHPTDRKIQRDLIVRRRDGDDAARPDHHALVQTRQMEERRKAERGRVVLVPHRVR